MGADGRSTLIIHLQTLSKKLLGCFNIFLKQPNQLNSNPRQSKSYYGQSLWDEQQWSDVPTGIQWQTPGLQTKAEPNWTQLEL
jgi:hypothetical protein